MPIGRNEWRVPLLLIALGSVVRVIYWIIYPPIYKLHAVFTPLDSSTIAYVSDFQSYIAVRMPFYDVFASIFYAPLAGILGIKALSAFSVLISIISVPLLYLSVRRLFDRQVAIYSLILYALYPKIAVLTGQGFPEAASVSFIIVALYMFTKGLPEHNIFWLGGSGVFILFSYLMFVPAVAVGIIFTVWLYVDCMEFETFQWNQLIPSWSFIAYSTPPGVVGVLYLVYGPLTQATGTVTGSWSNMASSIFVNDYGIVERFIRYVSYVYFDFWWHFRGYDKEDGILRILSSLQDFFGDFFIIYAIGWFAITGVCSTIIIYGIYSIINNRSRGHIIVLSWFLVFVLFYTSRNWGWTGVFQTRHVFPIFPAICIIFGIGANNVFERIGMIKNLGDKVDVSIHTIGVILLSFFLIILVVNGAVEGTMVAENHQLSKEQPVTELQGVVDPGETVAVSTRWDYYDVVIYSESTIRPKLLASTPEVAMVLQNWTVLADIEYVLPENLSRSHADYFYAAHCGDWRPYQQQYLDALNKTTAEVISQSTIERPAGQCTVRTIIIELPNR
jgi:hypothetical protein